MYKDRMILTKLVSQGGTKSEGHVTPNEDEYQKSVQL